VSGDRHKGRVGRTEANLAGLIGAVFFTVLVSHAFAANTADTLFFSRFGVEALPLMYIGLGVIGGAVLLGYSAGLGVVRRERFYPAVLILVAVVFAVLRVLVVLDQRWVYAATWIAGYLETFLTLAMLWNLAADVTDARSAKRLYPLLAGAGVAGAMTGNLLTGPLVGLIGPENVLQVVAVILVGAAWLFRTVSVRHGRVGIRRGGPGPMEELATGARMVRRTPLLARLAVAMVLGWVLFYAVVFPFSEQVAEAFDTETQIAEFLGFFSAAATGTTLVISLTLAGWLFRRVGIVGALLVVGIVYTTGFGLWLVSFGLWTAAVVRFAQWVSTAGIGMTARSALFNTVPSDHRGPVMGFMVAVPQQLGIALSGALLWLARDVLTTTQLIAAGLVVAVIFTAVLFSMRTHYQEALLASLRSGLRDVFLRVDTGIRLHPGAEVIRLLTDAASSDRVVVRRAALELITDVAADDLADVALARLEDDDLGVRLAAAEAAIAMGLGDEVDVARVFGLQDAIAGDLAGQSPAIWRRMAVARARLGDHDGAAETLRQAVGMESSFKAAALEGMAELGRVPDGCELPALLSDRSPSVRAAAVRAVAADQSLDHGPVLVALSDPTEQVRIAGAEAWRDHGLPTPPMLKVLGDGSLATREAALVALTPADGALHEEIRRRIEPILDSSRADARDAAAVESNGKVGAWIADLLTRRSRAAGCVVVRGVFAARHPDVGELIAGGLRSDDPDARAQAMEALEAEHDPLGTQFVATLESPAGLASSAEEALRRLAGDDDEWVRTLSQLALTERVDTPSDARTRPNGDSSTVSVSEAPTAHGEGLDVSERFDILSPAERVVALHDVPIFSSLAPADMHGIAAGAVEQTHAAGATLYRMGEPGEEMVVVIEGVLAATYRPDGTTKTFAEYGPGEQVGELSLLRNAPRASDVVAVTDVRVLVIPRAVLATVLEERPDVALAMLASIADRLAAVTVTQDDGDAGP
jgi:hypothetical protein